MVPYLLVRGGMIVALRLLLLVHCFTAAEALRTTEVRGEPRAFEVHSADDPGFDAPNAEDMALDWAVTEAVEELHPVDEDAQLMRSEAEWLRALHSDAANRTGNHSRGLYWHYGAHHKAGTDLLRFLAWEQDKLMGHDGCYSHGRYGFKPLGCTGRAKPAELWFWCNFSMGLIHDILNPGSDFIWGYLVAQSDGEPTRSSGGKNRAVHIIRDPIAMIVSGYIYHMHSEDTPPPLLHIRSLTMVEGLAEEARFQLARHMKEMVRTFAEAPPWVQHVRFESLTRSSKSFDRTVAAIYRHMLGDIYTEGERQQLMEAAARHDLRRNSSDGLYGHVAETSMKEKVMQVVMSIPKELLKILMDLRKSLGY